MNEGEDDFEALFRTRIVRGPLQLKRLSTDKEAAYEGMTEVQREAERAKEKRLSKRAADASYRDKIQTFNEKLAKLTDYNEMPRMSGS